MILEGKASKVAKITISPGKSSTALRLYINYTFLVWKGVLTHGYVQFSLLSQSRAKVAHEVILDRPVGCCPK